MNDCSDTVGNRTRDLPARSAANQPTAPPRAIILLCPAVFAVSYFVPLRPSIRVVSYCPPSLHCFVSVTTTEYINECLVNRKCLVFRVLHWATNISIGTAGAHALFFLTSLQ